MADKGYIKSLLNGISDWPSARKALTLSFQEVLDNFTAGPIDDTKRAINGQTYFFKATTPADALTEFTIVHGQGQAPFWIRAIAPTDAVNAQLVPLTISRVADEQRVYLTSSSTNATIYVEVGF